MKRQPAEIEQTLQECLDSIFRGEQTVEGVLAEYPELAEELRPRLDAALWLHAQGRGMEVGQESVRAARRRLIARIQEEQAVGGVEMPRRGILAFFRRWFANRGPAYRLAVVLAVLVGMIAGASAVGLRAHDAVSGESLYGVKLTLESARLAVTFDETQKARLHIEYAQTRMEEIETLVLERRLNRVAETVSRYESHMERALSSLRIVASLDGAQAKKLAMSFQETLAKQNLLLDALARAAPAETGVEIERALEIASAGLLTVESIAGQPAIEFTPTFTSTLLEPTVQASSSPAPTETRQAVTTAGVIVPPPSVSSPFATPETGPPSTTPTQLPAAVPPTAVVVQPANTPVPATKPPRPKKTARRTPTPTSTYTPTDTMTFEASPSFTSTSTSLPTRTSTPKPMDTVTPVATVSCPRGALFAAADRSQKSIFWTITNPDYQNPIGVTRIHVQWPTNGNNELLAIDFVSIHETPAGNLTWLPPFVTRLPYEQVTFGNMRENLVLTFRNSLEMGNYHIEVTFDRAACQSIQVNFPYTP